MDEARLSELQEENQRLRAEVDWIRHQIASGAGGDREAWLLGLLEHSPDVITVMSPDGKLLYLNRTVVEGQGVADTVGKNASDYVPPGDRERWIEALSCAVRTGEPQRVDLASNYDLYWETRLVPIRRGDEVVAVLSIGTDVTLRKSAERALAASEEKLRLALQASGVGLWSWDPKTDQVAWDDATNRVFAREEVGAPTTREEYVKMVHPDDVASVQARTARALATGVFDGGEYRIVTPGGDIRWVHTRGKFIRDGQGNLTQLLGAAFDVTQARRLETELRQASKMEAIGHLAGGVAHDFNNLLLAIMANASLARKNGDEHQRDNHLSEIVRAADRAALLTKQLLTFGRRDTHDRRSLDINEVMTDILSLLRRLIPESIDFEFTPGESLASISADSGQLEQVIVNLCVNARDSMPNGGRIALTTESASIDEEFTLSHPWARPGRYVVLSIVDSGHGMTAEVKERAFEPFFTTKEAGHGTGLGLSTVYGIVRQHGGLIHLDSESGRGTRFKVYFPADERPARAPDLKRHNQVVGGSELLVVAEDQELVRNVVVGLLENAGYRVLAAVDGCEAVDLVARHGGDVKLVLLDAIMPRKDGIDAAREIRARRPNLAVILSSGYTDAIATGRETPPHGIEFLPKPYEADALLRTVRRLIDHGHAA